MPQFVDGIEPISSIHVSAVFGADIDDFSFVASAPLALVPNTVNMFRDTRGPNDVVFGQADLFQFGADIQGGSAGLNEAIMYTQRIVNYVLTAAPTTETNVWYSTFNGTAWTPYVNTFTVRGATTRIDRNYIISKLMQQVFAHEGGGHDTRLTVTATTLGFHDQVGTGGMMDSQIQIITTTDNTAANPPGIKFRIPYIFLSGHLSGVTVSP